MISHINDNFFFNKLFSSLNNWFPNTDFFLAALDVASSKISQKSEVLAATVSFESWQDHQRYVKGNVLKNFSPFVYILLSSIDSSLNLLFSFFFSSYLSPNTLPRSLAPNYIVFIFIQLNNLTLELSDCFFNALNTLSTIFYC